MSSPDFSLSGVLPDWCWSYTIDIEKLAIDVDNTDETALTEGNVSGLTSIAADRVPIVEQTDPALLAVYPQANYKFLTKTYHAGILPGMQVKDQDGIVYRVIIDQAPAGAAYNRIIVQQLP